MTLKTRKRKRVSLNRFIVEWKKGEEETRDFVESAIRREGGNRVAIVRALLVAWAKRVNSRAESDITKAATDVAESPEKPGLS